jgi:hypothetical protein
MSENQYSLGSILDKKDFSVHLMDYKNYSKLSFCKNSKLFSYFLIEANSQMGLNHKSTLKILNENLKGVIHATDSYFHFFSDFVGPIYVFLKNCINQNIKKVELVIVQQSHQAEIFEKLFLFLQYCLDAFSDKIEIIQTRIQYSEEEKFFEINNSMIIQQQDIGISIDFIYNAAKNFSNSLFEKEPSKKVFISRKNDRHKDNSKNRNVYQDEIEDFFRSIGFEIVNGEGFSSLKQQISFFNEVKVFAGFTGSGLTSSMFMQPGQTLIEVVCPLKFGSEEIIKYEIHNFYKTISMLKKHKYLAISNINNSKEDVLKQLEDIAKML